MKRAIQLIALVLIVGAAPSLVAAQNRISGNELYQRVKAASVEILTEGRLNGSGWFADDKGTVVTAGHVIWLKNDLQIQTADGTRYPAKIVAVDRGHDLAILQADKSKGKHPFLRLASKSPSVGQRVFLYGAPIFRHHVMLTGHVAKDSPSFEYFFQEQQYVHTIYYTASSPSGTSGGCWVDRSGHVVGNQAGLINMNNAPVGIANVADVEAIRHLLKTRKDAQTATLGIAIEELVEKNIGYIKRYPKDTKGVVPTIFHRVSPGKDAGLTNNMVITYINQKKVQFRDDLLNVVRTHKPGEKVKLKVIMADSHEQKVIDVKLDHLEAKPKPKAKSKPVPEKK